MLRRTLVIALVTSLASIALAAPASAGGWWSSVPLEKQHANIGDTLHSRSDVWFPTMKLAQRARSERYFAYLVRGINQKLLDDAMGHAQPKRWWAQPETAIRAGTVRWGGRDSNIATVIVDVTIPDVPPGRYALMLCDAGCRNPLADIIPTEGLHVYASGAEAAASAAQAVADVKEFRFETKMMDQSLAVEIDELREDAVSSQDDAGRAADNAARAQQAVRRLEFQVEALAAREPVSPWPATAGWAVTGLVTLLWLGTLYHRRRTPPPSSPAPEVAVDDEWEYAGRR